MSAAETAPPAGFGALLAPDARALLTRLSAFLNERGVAAYLAGGFILDTLLARRPADIDIAVAADARAVAGGVAEALGGRYVCLDAEHGVGRVVLPGGNDVDFTSLAATIEADLARRDFTVNALAWALNPLARGGGGPLIDPHGGCADLRAGIIRAVSPDIFRDDAVRLLRAVRLAAEYDFTIAAETEARLRREARLAAGVSGERVREELSRLLRLAAKTDTWFYLDRLGLLTALIPEMAPEKGVSQPREHYWDVFEHSLMTLSAVDYLLHRGDWPYGDGALLALSPWSTELSEHFNRPVSALSDRRALLKLAALLHDIAKPETKALQPDGRTRFLGHAPEGAATAARIMERLRFSGREIRYVSALIEHHLRPTQMSHEGMPSRRAIYRYFRDTGEAGIDILFLSLADHLASRGPTLDREAWGEHARLVEYVLEQRFAESGLVAPPRLLDGHELIGRFGLEPGPQIGALLAAIEEAQAAGEIGSREEALAFAGRWLEGREQTP